MRLNQSQKKDNIPTTIMFTPKPTSKRKMIKKSSFSKLARISKIVARFLWSQNTQNLNQIWGPILAEGHSTKINPKCVFHQLITFKSLNSIPTLPNRL